MPEHSDSSIRRAIFQDSIKAILRSKQQKLKNQLVETYQLNPQQQKPIKAANLATYIKPPHKSHKTKLSICDFKLHTNSKIGEQNSSKVIHKKASLSLHKEPKIHRNQIQQFDSHEYIPYNKTANDHKVQKCYKIPEIRLARGNSEHCITAPYRAGLDDSTMHKYTAGCSTFRQAKPQLPSIGSNKLLGIDGPSNTEKKEEQKPQIFKKSKSAPKIPLSITKFLKSNQKQPYRSITDRQTVVIRQKQEIVPNSLPKKLQELQSSGASDKYFYINNLSLQSLIVSSESPEKIRNDLKKSTKEKSKQKKNKGQGINWNLIQKKIYQNTPPDQLITARANIEDNFKHFESKEEIMKKLGLKIKREEKNPVIIKEENLLTGWCILDDQQRQYVE